MKQSIRLQVNGQFYEIEVEPRETLLDALRDKLNLTGARRGCESGFCGACSVLLDGILVHSCSLLAVRAQDREIMTIEGLAQNGELHAIQKAFIQYGAIQCGYCTPGMILAAKALLDEISNPTETEVRAHLASNLCRCTGYRKIVKAVLAVAEHLKP